MGVGWEVGLRGDGGGMRDGSEGGRGWDERWV